MSQIGLSQENILKMLEEKGINAGRQFSATKLREAIAEAIAENNKEIEKNITKVVAKVLFGEIKKTGK